MRSSLSGKIGSDMEEFFKTNQRKTVLAEFKLKVDGLTHADDFEKQRNDLIKLVIGSMEDKPDQWDELCKINIKWIGEQFIRVLANEEQELTKERLDYICSMCFRFLFELYLSSKNDLARDFEDAKRFVFKNVESFEHQAKETIEYAIYDLPINIFKAISNSDAIDNIKNFNAVYAKAEKLKDKWDSEISEKEARVNSLKESLSEYENAFNFVGLYQGFDELSTEKNKERGGILFWLRFLSVLTVLPIVAKLIYVYMHLENISAVRDGLIVSIFPMVSLVAISLYYFRVLLFNYKSVKSQLLQIDLRKTLCRFIQSYSEYSSEMKKKGENSLDKFESIVFSGIVTDDGRLPSTFDGMDQIEKLIKAAKS